MTRYMSPLNGILTLTMALDHFKKQKFDNLGKRKRKNCMIDSSVFYIALFLARNLNAKYARAIKSFEEADKELVGVDIERLKEQRTSVVAGMQRRSAFDAVDDQLAPFMANIRTAVASYDFLKEIMQTQGTGSTGSIEFDC